VNLWTVVPIKDFAAAKERLSPVLSCTEREQLAQKLARRTLDLLVGIGTDHVVIVTRGARAADMATSRGFVAMDEQGTSHSEAVAQATEWARERGAEGVLALATDLPILATDDITMLVRRARAGTFVIAPDRLGVGTNAIAVAPPVFAYQFGPDSFRRHLAQASRRGLDVQVVRTPGLAVDLDTAADLDLVPRSMPELHLSISQ